MADRTLTFIIAGDAKKLQTSLDQASGSIKQTGSHFDGLKTAALGAVSGFAALEAGKKVVDFLEDATKAAMADQEAMARVGVSVKNAGENWKGLEPAIDDTLTKMSETSGFIKSDLADAFSKLELATGNHTKALALESDAENIAAQTGKPLAAVALALGKAYDGSAGALKRLGVITPSVTTAQDALIKSHKDLIAEGVKLTQAQKDAYTVALAAAKADDKEATSTLALDTVHKKFADGVADRNKTMAGEMLVFQARWENVKVQIGDTILPYLTKGMAQLLSSTQQLTQWWDSTGSKNFIQDWQAVSPVVVPILKGISTSLLDVTKGLVDLVKTANDLLHGDWTKAWQDGSSVVKENVAAMLAPIRSVAGAVQDEVGPTEAAAKHLGNNIVSGVESGLDDLGSSVTSKVGAVTTAIKGAWGDVESASEHLGGNVVGGVERGLSGLGAAMVADIIGPINAVISKLDGIHVSIPGVSIPGIGKVGGQSFGFDIPHLARGGITTGPTVALIGESGPEAVIPLSRSGGVGAGVSVHIHAQQIIGAGDLAKVVTQALIEAKRRGNNNLSLAI